MESYEAKHSNQSFTSRLAMKLGVTKPPLRLDSQTKYGDTQHTRMICFLSSKELIFNPSNKISMLISGIQQIHMFAASICHVLVIIG